MYSPTLSRPSPYFSLSFTLGRCSCPSYNPSHSSNSPCSSNWHHYSLSAYWLALPSPTRRAQKRGQAKDQETEKFTQREAPAARYTTTNMRRSVVIFLVTTIIILGFAVHNVWTLLSLLVVTGREDQISRAELPAPNSGAISQRPQLIPKIIHQTYINESIPAHWKDPQQSCLDLHPDYEYKLWTDKKSREFIAAEYPWFLETFDGYPYPIQRADAIRYFVLHHYGGIYIDLDDGCNRSLDPLLAYPAWVRRTNPTGISNDAMGSVPRHPFFLKAIDSLPEYNRRWVLPYITVMGSTGPLFLSLIWRHYNNAKPQEMDRVRILFPDEYNNHSWSFFTHHLGNSWHNNDVKFIFWLERHWVLITIIGFAVGLALLWCVYSTFFLQRQTSPGPRMRFPCSRRLPFYRRISSKDIPLDDRHEV